MLKRYVIAPLKIALTWLVALVLLFEEWGWQPLSRAFAALARLAPLAKLEAWIGRLPPYGALAVFVVPTLLLFPLKLVALWLLAQGQHVAALALLVGAKLAGTGLVARIYIVTKAQLMQIWWVARLHDVYLPWQEAVFARVRASWPWRFGRVMKSLARRRIARIWARLGAV